MPRGIYPGNKGRKRIFSEEHRRKLSEAGKGRKYAFAGLHEDKQVNWKGDNVGYRAIHIWVEKHLGKPRICEDCGDTSLKHRQYHWANISRNYKRLITDWRRLCVKCHKAYDRVKSENI